MSEQEKKVSNFLETVQKINSCTNLHDLLATINTQLTGLIEVAVSAILVYDAKDQELYFLQARENTGVSVSGIKIPIHDRFTSWVVRNNQAVLLKNNEQKGPAPLAKLSTYNLAVIPLMTAGKAIGVLEVIKKSESTFKPEEITFLSELANHIAITLDNTWLYKYSHNQLKSAIAVFSNAADKRDYLTHFHSKRVRDYALIFSAVLDLTPTEKEHLELAAVLHDIGKIGIPDDVLLKSGQLTEEEYAVVKEHPVKGAEIISLLKEISPDIIATVRHHHERWDGKGYPEGLSGEKIPYLARILAICDVFDALTSDRPFRARKPAEEARDLIIKNKKLMFDPELVERFLSEYRQMVIKGKIN
jgi:HD-GYP domain-containing protein (c-di-GMP phosphodiesterase class II)